MTDRTDVAVVGYLTPDMPFYIGQRSIGSTDKVYKFIAYYTDPNNISLSHYVVLESAITYYTNGGDGIPENYQLHYFKYIQAQENSLQFTLQAFLDFDFKISANSYTNYLVYNNGKLQLGTSTKATFFNFSEGEVGYSQYPNDSFLIHAGIQGTLLASTTSGASKVPVAIEYYTKSSNLSNNSVYDGMPIGVNESSSTLSSPLTSFFPVNWYNRFGFPINNPVYHYCPSQSESSSNFYINFCKSNFFDIAKGNTSLEDNRVANGVLYYYPSVSEGTCNSTASFKTFLGGDANNIKTYQPIDDQNICSYNGKEFQSIPKPTNLNNGIIESCQNSEIACNLDISNCKNVTTTCKPFCNNNCCEQATFGKCKNANSICNALFPSEKIPTYIFIIIGVLVSFLLIIGAVAIYFWMHRSTEEQCINLLKNIRSKNK